MNEDFYFDCDFKQLFCVCLLTKRKKSVILLDVAGVAQSVVQLIRNQQVAGSSPVTSSKNPGRMGLDFFIYIRE